MTGVVEERGDTAQLVEDRTAGGFRRVGGEDRADVQVLDGLLQVFGVGVLEPVRRSGEESAFGGPLGAQLAAAVHLLGDIRQMEVRGEGADQLGRGLQFGAAQQLGGCLAVLAGQAADLLDQFQELGALLTDEGLTEQVAQAADVGAQLAAGRRGLVVGTAHRCGSLQCGSSAEECGSSSEARQGGNPDGGRAAGCRLGTWHPGRKQNGPRCPTESKDRCPCGRAGCWALAARLRAAILTTP
jgi:hypothetical protein